MAYRLTKIYTRKGDSGFTCLGDRQLSKDDALIDALGNIDELNASIGMILTTETVSDEVAHCLISIQHDLFNLGAELHLPERVMITPEKVADLEIALDRWNSTLPPLSEFILPGGNPASAACHVARTVCRRAERSLVKRHRQVSLSNPEMLCYLNRLSDLLFVVARILNRATQTTEVLWNNHRPE